MFKTSQFLHRRHVILQINTNLKHSRSIECINYTHLSSPLHLDNRVIPFEMNAKPLRKFRQCDVTQINTDMFA